MGRSVAEGRFQVPTNWPAWNKTCGAKRKQGGGNACSLKAVVGMPTCRFHGSGGKRNRELGQLRYLAWIICGGPQDIPIEHACRIALAVYAEAVLNQGKGTLEQQMRAAMWMTSMLD